MSIMETAPVHPSSVQQDIPSLSDEVIEGYQRIADAVHAHGMKIFQQLWHGGHCSPNPMGGPPWSASDVPNPVIGLVPVPMSKGMIDEVVAGFAATARRCKEGGLDGIEVHAAHGYLPAQFFSAATNKRDDEYGPDSLENKTRFCREILIAIRAEVGPDFPICVRLVADEEYEGGMTADDAIEIAKLLEPHIDLLNVSLGGYYRPFKMLSPMDDPLGYELPKTRLVTREINVPTIVTGRIMTLDHASQIVADGTADMVSMVRALIADPELVRKSREGRTAEVRPCIGSSQGCVGGAPRFNCVVNVGAGTERTVSADVVDPAPVTKRVMIAGAGPAGLETARMAALRGHEVSVYEMTNKVGGQVAIAASAPHRSDVGAITAYLAAELERLGVPVTMRTFVEPELVATVKPDVVIVATGSTPRRDGFQASRPAYELPGVEQPHVYTSWDVFGFGGQARVGSRAVVYDDSGSYESICVSEELLERGAEVTLVTRHSELAATVPQAARGMYLQTGPARERLLPNPRFHLLTDRYLVEITATDVEVGFAFGGTSSRSRHPADTVVLIGHNHPNRELAEALSGNGIPVHVIGDAAGGTSLQGALHQGAFLARTL
jgi:2,4-dienoyl-CoA reductase-like NADH-dependent reductase (Old Yellow Enzyme family)/thioredoxin reductase